MFEGLVSKDSISFVLVFIEGVLSFLSPCVLPLIPLYIGYLAGNGNIVNDDGIIIYKRKKVLIHTIFFVMGISTTFFTLGISFTVVGSFFKSNNFIFSKIAGIIIIVLGLFQLGIFNFKFLQRQHKFNINLKNKKINPFMAYIMGFTFSFAWTPCVGPTLSSVLILASSSKNALIGNLLVLIYALGFVVPFLILGVFTTQVLNFINKNKNIMKYTIKTSGVIMILIGIITFTGWINNITGYLNSASRNDNTIKSSEGNNVVNQEESKNQENLSEEEQYTPNNSDNKQFMEAIDFTLVDQYGNTHKLSDYKGKTVFLNFWATWCPPCKMEMPNIEELYTEFNYNKEDIIVLGIAQPGESEKDVEGIKNFLEEQGYTFPVLFDESGEVFNKYYINSLPTTFMINKDGKIYGYVSGALSKDQMKNIINQTKDGI